MGRYQSLNDQELVGLVIKGNGAAFSEIYDRYVKMVYSKCKSFVRISDEADDLTQIIFIKMHAKLNLYEEGNFPAWVMRMTYNSCVDYHRKNSKVHFEEINEETFNPEQEEYDVSDDHLFEVKYEKLLSILEQIDPMDKMIILLKYKDDMKISDIELLTGLSKSAVKMRLNRSKKKIIHLNSI